MSACAGQARGDLPCDDVVEQLPIGPHNGIAPANARAAIRESASGGGDAVQEDAGGVLDPRVIELARTADEAGRQDGSDDEFQQDRGIDRRVQLPTLSSGREPTVEATPALFREPLQHALVEHRVTCGLCHDPWHGGTGEWCREQLDGAADDLSDIPCERARALQLLGGVVAERRFVSEVRFRRPPAIHGRP